MQAERAVLSEASAASSLVYGPEATGQFHVASFGKTGRPKAVEGFPRRLGSPTAVPFTAVPRSCRVGVVGRPACPRLADIT
jgi:hypothetical protein